MSEAAPASDSMDGVRDRIVLAALPHVPFEGWSRTSLRAAATDLGLDETMVERAFAGGASAAVAHFAELADRRMSEEAAAKADELAAMRFTARVGWLVRHRLEPWTAQREAVRRAIALPRHAGLAARTAWRTADAIWYAAGDASTDFSFYTKRATLAAVYTATLLYWLDDASEGCAATWEFLERRLADVGRVAKLRGQIERRIAKVPNPFEALAAAREGRRRPRRKSRATI